jgi:hypothetical protein
MTGENARGRTGGGLLKPSYLLHATAALFFLYAFSLSIKPFSTGDLWFHLSTGKWIVRNMALPGAEDPFSYTTGPVPENKVGHMRSQWLGQVLFHLFYSAGGPPALAVSKGLIIVLPFLWLYATLVRRRTPPAIALMIISFPLLFSVTVGGSFFERPQAFSFIASVFAVYLLERLKAAPGRTDAAACVGLPVLMAVWANLHGGHVVGDVLIIGYMAAEAVNSGLARFTRLGGGERRIKAVPWRFFAVCAAALAASFLNPNTYNTLHAALSGFWSNLWATSGERAGYVARQMVEYRSLWFLHKYFYVSWPFYYIAFIGMVVIAAVAKYIRAGRVDLSEFAAVLMIGFISVFYVRAMLFSAYVFPLYLGFISSSFGKRWRAVAAGSVLCLCLVFAAGERSSFALVPSAPDRWEAGVYPDGAIEFLKQQDVKGPLYNPVHWGGYIIFKAYPEYRVFVDERSISNKVLEAAHVITNAGPGWRTLLDAYGVNAIVIPLIAVETKDTVPLARALVWDDAWKLVYLRDDTAVFVRASGPNGGVAGRFEIPKDAIWEEMLRVSHFLLRVEPGNPLVHMARTEAFVHLKRYEEARSSAALTRKAAAAVGGRRAEGILRKLRAMGY